MSHEMLTCPSCHCPVKPQAGSATGLSCPRCNTWIEIDAACTGGCMSCHKAAVSEKSGSCADSEDAVPVAISSGVTSACASSCSGDDPKNKSSRSISWKSLFKRLF